jgi:hypothetical protein
MLSVIMLRVGFSYCYAECCYAECHYAKCRYAEYRGAIFSDFGYIFAMLSVNRAGCGSISYCMLSGIMLSVVFRLLLC